MHSHAAPDKKHETESSDDWMKGTSAGPGGSLTSKPTWLNALGVRPRWLFFIDRPAYLRQDESDEHPSGKSAKPARAKPQFDYLDNRIVPAALLPHMVVAADVVHANLRSPSQHLNHATASATSAIQIRHALRLEVLADRREKVLVLREEAREWVARQARLAASHVASHLATPAVQPVGHMTGATFTLPSGRIVGQVAGAPSTKTSSVGTVSTTGSSSSSGTSTGSSISTNLLPPNAGQQLEIVYQEFLNGDLPTATNQPGPARDSGNECRDPDSHQQPERIRLHGRRRGKSGLAGHDQRSGARYRGGFSADRSTSCRRPDTRGARPGGC